MKGGVGCEGEREGREGEREGREGKSGSEGEGRVVVKGREEW